MGRPGLGAVSWRHVVLLALWMAAGAALRFAHLDAKPLWADEFSTIAFALGHGYRDVPLDRAITGDVLLAPLRPAPGDAIAAVPARLAGETNHPPVYFLLAHAWLDLWASPGVVVSAWAGRSLAAAIGVATIPAVFLLARLASGSVTAAQVAAAFAAFSPLGVALAQEARPYTLAILLATASLAGLVAATRSWRAGTPLALPVCAGWIAVNALGVATHFLFLLVLGAEALALAALLGRPLPAPGRASRRRRAGWRLAGVAVGSALGVGAWLPPMRASGDGALLAWLERSAGGWAAQAEPLAHTLAAAATMLYLLPVQAASPAVAKASAAGVAALALGTGVLVARGLRRPPASPDRPELAPLWTFAAAAIALLLGVTYLAGKNVALVFRYHFVYLPAVLVIAGAMLARAPWTIAPALVASLLGALTVVADLGYQKTHRPDLVAADLLRRSPGAALVAIPHRTHGQTGRLMGIETALRKAEPTATRDVRYLLARAGPDEGRTVAAALDAMSRPVDVWLLEFDRGAMAALAPSLGTRGCTRLAAGAVDGYRYIAFRCPGEA
jgi:uncharacterized membrane protein